jgi:hypothetical protein
VQRIHSDNSVAAGRIKLSGGKGATLVQRQAADTPYVEVNFVGDPTYLSRAKGLPGTGFVQLVRVVDTHGHSVNLHPGDPEATLLSATDAHEENPNDDALRIESYGSKIKITLNGK